MSDTLITNKQPMYKTLWKNLHSAVCSIGFYTNSGIKLSSLTGFKVNNYIITDQLIYKIQRCDEVVFQFVQEDGLTISLNVKMPFWEFTERLNRTTEFENEGFALIEFEGINTNGIISLDVDLDSDYTVGEEIAVIGYHIDQENLCIKNGIISSFYKALDDKKLIQFEASIKLGNSGSPLINVRTGKVIGVVGYQLTSLTRTYEAFKNIIDENLRILKKSEGKMNIMDIDPIQVLIANQNQLKQLSREYYRSAAMSFGLAYEVQNIYKYLVFKNNSVVTIDSKKVAEVPAN